MTRLGNLLHFGQLFKAFGNNNFAQIATFLGKLLKVSKSYIFLVKSVFGNFIDIWQPFTGHTEQHTLFKIVDIEGVNFQDWASVIIKIKRGASKTFPLDRFLTWTAKSYVQLTKKEAVTEWRVPI